MIPETDLAYLLQQLLNAAPTAALYAMLAFGYSLSFGLTKRADFTPGALFAFAGQMFVFFTSFGYDRLWLVYPAALALGAVVAFLYTLLAASLVGSRVIRPLSSISPNSVIIASLAIMITLMELVRIAADARDLWLSPFLNARLTIWNAVGFPVVLTQIQVINASTMAAIVIAASLFLARSHLGRQWRAVCDDSGAAQLLGVNSGRVLITASLVTAAFSAVAGIMATGYYGSMDFGSGLMFGLKVVMIAAIGDQSSPAKSALGAAIFGIVETLWGAYMAYLWRDLAMFSLLVILAVLLRREKGFNPTVSLLGHRRPWR
ncbi:MAG: branched-chain amino acid transporter permease [Rhizobium sp.]|nr:branched-chain amino acid transporter permease [Rhizobium sp.]